MWNNDRLAAPRLLGTRSSVPSIDTPLPVLRQPEILALKREACDYNDDQLNDGLTLCFET